MKNQAAKWRSRLIWIEVVMGSWLLLLVARAIFVGHALSLQGQCMVQHEVILNELTDRFNADSEVPKELSYLDPPLLPEKIQHNLKYDSSAWHKSGKILLHSKIFNSHVITFGDGTVAILSHWDDKAEGMNRRLGRSGPFGPYPVALITKLIAVFFVLIVISERILKKKQISG